MDLYLPLNHNLLLIDTDTSTWGLYVGLFFASFVKFGIAAVAAMGNNKLNFVEILLTIGGGALLSVPFYTYFGDQVRRLIRRYVKRRRPVSFARRRRTYIFWKRYGLAGVAFLCPIISPMVSVSIAIAFQESPRRIIVFVGSSVIFWTFVFAFLRRGVLNALEQVQGLV